MPHAFARASALAVLLLAGVALARTSPAPWFPNPFMTVSLLAAALVTLVAPLRRLATRGLDALREAPAPKVAAALFLAAAATLAYSTVAQHAYTAPKSHDEHSYTLGARMLAAGRLWTASPPHPDSFESFHMLVRPAYASIYAPGTALLHAAGLLCHVAPWVTAILVSAAAVAGTYAMLRGVLGGDTATFASLLLLAAPQFRAQAILTMSQVPALLWGTTFLAACLAWRRAPTALRATLAGTLAGLLVITRPQDLAVYGPAGLATLIWRCPRPRSLAWGALATCPFLLLLAVQNYGLTGSPLRTGYWTYTQASQPGTGFTAAGPVARPQTIIPQKIEYNDAFGGQARADRAQGLLPELARRAGIVRNGILPSPWLLALLPLGVAGLCSRREGRAVLLPVVCFAALYGSFTFFLDHYAVCIAGLLVATPAAATVTLGTLAPRLSDASRVTIACLAAAIAVSSVPGINPRAGDLEMAIDQIVAADALSAQLRAPSLVLVRFAHGDSVHQEPVYNLDAWRVTDNRVIRAHDLGPDENRELFRALPAHPDRDVYRFDRRARTVEFLGKLSDLRR